MELVLGFAYELGGLLGLAYGFWVRWGWGARTVTGSSSKRTMVAVVGDALQVFAVALVEVACESRHGVLGLVIAVCYAVLSRVANLQPRQCLSAKVNRLPNAVISSRSRASRQQPKV